MTAEDRPKSDQADTEPPTLPPNDSTFDEPTIPPEPESEDATVAPTTREATVGDRVRYFGDYELLEEIARGGMGVVYQARQINLNRTVALKMILAGQLAGEQDVQRFHTEAEAAAQLDHPGIVPIFEIGEHDGQHYFSMGFIEGQSLAQRINDQPPSPEEAAELMTKVCDAISYAHQHNVIHRDLKPANILLDPSGQPKVTDFGLAKKTEADSDLTGTGQILGTPAYMPPEQAAGNVNEVGPLADVYSLGAVLYCLLTGRPPFQAASPMDTLLQVLDKEPAAPRQIDPAVPVDLETICLKCLEKEPSRRYESAAALAADLRRYLDDEPIEARPSSTAYKLWRKAKRNRTTSLALAGALLAAFVGTIFFFQSRHTATRERAAQKSAKGARDALQRIQTSTGIRQLAITPFENLSGNPDEDWLGAGFASVLQTKLSGHDLLKIVGKGPMEEAASALGISADATMDESQALKFGKQLVVNYVITGEFQRVAEQIQVSARLVNIETGAVEKGGMQVQGEFARVFDLQTDLANQCLVQLGAIEDTDQDATENQETPAVAAAPAASVDAWMFLGRGQQALADGDFDQAIRLCARATEEDPKLWKAYRTQGIAYTKIDEAEGALQAFEDAIEINPQDWTSKAYYNLLSGRLVEGLDAFGKAEEAGDADLDLLKLSTSVGIKINQASGGGKFAVDELRAAIDKHPDDEGLPVLLATAQTNNGDIQDAVETLKRAVELKPRKPEPHLMLSLALEKLGDKDQADRELAEAEKYRPDGIRGFREFGDVFADAGEQQRAIEEFNQALQIDSNDPASHLQLGELLLSSDIVKAMGHFESALVGRPDSTQILSVLCRLYNLFGQNQKLQEYASRWVDADQDSYEAHQYLRLVYLKTGQMAKADAELTKIAELNPRHKTFFVMTGNTLIQTSLNSPSMIDEAIRVLKKGEESFPNDSTLPMMLKFSNAIKLWHEKKWQHAARIFEELTQEVEGADVLTQALRRDCFYFGATCYEQLDRMQEATDLIRQAVQLLPALSRKAFSIYEKARSYGDAIELAKSQIAANPNDLKLHRDLIRYLVLSGKHKEAKNMFADLPSATADDWKRRVNVGVALADWTHRSNQSGSASEQSIESLLAFASRGTDNEVPPKMLAAYSRWAKFPQQVLVIGPFDGSGGLDTSLPPESEFDPEASYPGIVVPLGDQRDLRWQVVSCRAGDRFDLRSLKRPDRSLVAYFATHLVSPEEQPVTLVIDGNYRGKAWLNDQPLKLVRRQDGSAGIDVVLRKGANRLLGKSLYEPDMSPLTVNGQWNASLRAIDANGWPAAVRWSTDSDFLRGEARALVYDLETRLIMKQDIIDRLQQDELLQGKKRDDAFEIANELPEDRDRISIERVQREFADHGDPRQIKTVIHAAASACRDDPSDRESFGALAWACYLASEFDTAIKAASRAIELDRQQIGLPHPAHLAVLSMSHHQLDHDADASDAFVRLHDLMIGLSSVNGCKRALREATSVLNEAIPETNELDSIKQIVFQAHRSGWKNHRFNRFEGILADDFKLTVGRGPMPGEYDLVVDRDTYEAVKKLKYQEPAPGQGSYVAHQAVDGAIDGDEAWLTAEYTVSEPNGFVIEGRKLRLRRDGDRWKVYETRRWPILMKSGDQLTEYNASTWAELDSQVEKFEQQGNLRSLSERLRRGYRFSEMMEITDRITNLPNANANDWRIRGLMAFSAFAPDEIIRSYRRAAELNPNIYVPEYAELVEAAPEGFSLQSADLPASREGTIRSITGGPASQFVFKNQTEYTLNVYWLNYQGQRKGPYRQIRPGATWDYQGAQRNHPWLVTDSQGRGLGIFIADKASRTIELKPAESLPTTQQ